MDHRPYIRKTEHADTAVLMIHGIMGKPPVLQMEMTKLRILQEDDCQ